MIVFIVERFNYFWFDLILNEVELIVLAFDLIALKIRLSLFAVKIIIFNCKHKQRAAGIKSCSLLKVLIWFRRLIIGGGVIRNISKLIFVIGLAKGISYVFPIDMEWSYGGDPMVILDWGDPDYVFSMDMEVCTSWL